MLMQDSLPAPRAEVRSSAELAGGFSTGLSWDIPWSAQLDENGKQLRHVFGQSCARASAGCELAVFATLSEDQIALVRFEGKSATTSRKARRNLQQFGRAEVP